jgi:WD40 repeat protein
MRPYPFTRNPGLFGIALVVVFVLAGRLYSVSLGLTGKSRVVELKGLIAVPHHSGLLAFSADGKLLALPKRDRSDVEIWDLASGQANLLVSSFSNRTVPGDSIAFSSDGHLLAVYYRNRSLTIWDLPANKERSLVRVAAPSYVTHMAFTDGNRTLLTITQTVRDRDLRAQHWNSSATRWDVSTGNKQGEHDFDPVLEAKALSPRGRFALFHREGVGQTGFILETGEKAFAIVSSGEFVFSDDGSALASYDGDQASLWAVPSGRLLRHFDFKPGNLAPGYFVYPGCLSASPDKKVLAVAMFTRTNVVGLISMESGKILETIECCPAPMMCDFVRFSPDGSILVTDTERVTTFDQEVAPLLRFWKLPASW